MKKALVHDWFISFGGAEKCIESFTNVWGDFNIYALYDFLEDNDRKEILKDKKATTSFLQNLPKAKQYYQNYLPLFPLAIEQFDLNEYDLILSSSHAVAKGVLTHEHQLHICYMHTPMRYAWDLYHQYLREANLSKSFKGKFVQYILHKIRIWDISSINRVDYYIANSNYVARRIKKIYGKDSEVIYPPVDTHYFTLEENKEDFYLTVLRNVPYKKLNLIVETFAKIGKKLVIIGEKTDQLSQRIPSNIVLLGYQNKTEIKHYMQKAKAFVYVAKEDFGISVVEAQACGTPVICLGQGGTKETVIDKVTGIHFYNQTLDDLLQAIEQFENKQNIFDPKVIRKHALQFSTQRFEKQIQTFIEDKYSLFKAGKQI